MRLFVGPNGSANFNQLESSLYLFQWAAWFSVWLVPLSPPQVGRLPGAVCVVRRGPDRSSDYLLVAFGTPRHLHLLRVPHRAPGCAFAGGYRAPQLASRASLRDGSSSPAVLGLPGTHHTRHTNRRAWHEEPPGDWLWLW
jgi:hypothetical protein